MPRYGNPLINLLTGLVLLSSACICSFYGAVLVAPNAPFNPFPQPPLPPIAQLATTVPAPTAVPTLIPSETPVPPPTVTPTFTATEVVVVTDTPTLEATTEGDDLTPIGPDTATPETTPDAGVTPTATIEAPPGFDFTYSLQPGNPVATRHATAGCTWMGVAGQVFDSSGSPVTTGLIISIEGPGILLDGLVGAAPSYGDGGYEIQLADQPIESSDEYSIEVLDEDGDPQSDVILFDTYADCNRNLILINFVENP